MSNSSRVAALALLLAGLPAAAATMEDTVAVVNGSPVLLSEYQKEVTTALDYWGKTNPMALADPANVRKIRESTLEELITRDLLVQQAEQCVERDGGIGEAEDVEFEAEQLRDRLLAAKAFEQQIVRPQRRGQREEPSGLCGSERHRINSRVRVARSGGPGR